MSNLKDFKEILTKVRGKMFSDKSYFSQLEAFAKNQNLGRRQLIANILQYRSLRWRNAFNVSERNFNTFAKATKGPLLHIAQRGSYESVRNPGCTCVSLWRPKTNRRLHIKGVLSGQRGFVACDVIYSTKKRWRSTTWKGRRVWPRKMPVSNSSSTLVR